jgi:hypothetical protein
VSPAGPRAPRALTGRNVYRIHWLPGTDRLHAVCHCGAERDFEDPVELWDWLLAHPDGHRPPGAGQPTAPAGAGEHTTPPGEHTTPPGEPRAALV